ncbi:MAG TPA: ferredoxin [Perlabentimonas sp.]|jgi:ferredoxin|nr:ferredoxin [Bacteroidales bacterium]HZJ73988.1 ferredoxin [Perlabentimonas sp.]
MTTAKLQILRYKCIACGLCLSVAPDVFILSQADGKLTWVKTPNFNDDVQLVTDPNLLTDIALQMVGVCPERALSIG